MWKINGNYNPAVKPTCSIRQGSRFCLSGFSKPLLCTVLVDSKEVEFEIDSGAALSLMHVETFSKLFPSKNLIAISAQPTGISAPVKLKGVTEVNVTIPGNKCHKLELYV